MEILDGKAVAKAIKQRIAEQVARYVEQGLRAPCLAVLSVGNDPASAAYIKNKVKACAEVGFKSVDINLPQDVSQSVVIDRIKQLNSDDSVDGFIIQLPLPEHIDEFAVIQAIDPQKDVDGFHPENLGKLLLGQDGFEPATPRGIKELLRYYGISLQGRDVVIVGRSNIVGKPLALMLMQNTDWANATVTVCHSRTRNLQEHTLRAEVLIVAIGKPRFITASMVREGAIVIDVGINAIADPSRKTGYRLVGDVDFDSVAPKTSYITPVPGGVGQVTVAALLLNTLKAYQQRFGLRENAKN